MPQTMLRRPQNSQRILELPTFSASVLLKPRTIITLNQQVQAMLDGAPDLLRYVATAKVGSDGKG